MAETAKDKAGLSVGESTGSSAANEPLGRTGAMSASTCHKNGAIGESITMSAATQHKPIVHIVGSIPLPDAETVFHTVAAATVPPPKSLPDG